MSLPSRVGRDACSLEERWDLDPALADMLVRLDQRFSEDMERAGFFWPGIFIISGYRSAARQSRVNPTVPGSLHVVCPSLAVDLRVGSVQGIGTGAVWAALGARWKLLGGRWGGDFKWEGSPLPNPKEWNHFDLGVGV